MQPFAPAAFRAPASSNPFLEDVMRKLKLDLDQLVVDSFRTEPAPRKPGTVFGEQCTCYTNCTCPGCPTCDASCNGTCGGTCAASCNGTCAGTCDASCNGTCDYSCGGTCDVYCGGTEYDHTCNNYGTCHWGGGPCYLTPA
jgi:hypothetical protein